MGRYDAYKEHVLRVSRALWEGGYFGTRSGSAGNVSVLVPGEEAVAVTPSGKPYADMIPEDVCVVDFSLRKLDARHEPSIETPLHVAVYRNRPDVGAVIHTHQLYASVLAVLNEPIPPLFDEVAITIGDRVEVVPYGLSGSPELLGNVVAKLRNRCHCYLLQNHGALCVGPDLDRTLTSVEMLEKIAMIYTLALSTGRRVTTLPADIVAALFTIVIGKQDLEVAHKRRVDTSAC